VQAQLDLRNHTEEGYQVVLRRLCSSPRPSLVEGWGGGGTHCLKCVCGQRRHQPLKRRYLRSNLSGPYCAGVCGAAGGPHQPLSASLTWHGGTPVALGGVARHNNLAALGSLARLYGLVLEIVLQ
jgi:hypothetical protein